MSRAKFEDNEIGAVCGNSEEKEKIQRLRDELNNADAVVIGAGLGLSASAGLVYSGKRFEKYFEDFCDKYGFCDMYAGGFYPYKTLEEKWAYWSRYIYVNRFVKPPKDVYDKLYDIIDGRNKGDAASQPKTDYFVVTTNIDHQFKKAGFSKRRIFYSQGDYGLWQCSKPCHQRTHDNKAKIIKMVLAQGFVLGDEGILVPPVKEDGTTDFDKLSMVIPSDLVPYCPVCGEPMTMNLREDDTFVEDEGYHEASGNYEEFLDSYKGQHVLFLELGVGAKTPVKIKYPFWEMTEENENAVYASINLCEGFYPKSIRDRAICITGDIGEVIDELIKE